MPTSPIALLSLAAVSSAEFDFLGHGACATITQPYVAKNGTYIEESHKKQFEHWYKSGGSCSGFPGHETHGDAEMEALCEKTPACLGFDYGCCDNTKEKCIAGGRLLFGLNTRPDGDAPPGFSLHGYRGFPTSGPDYQAEAPGGVNGGINVLTDVGVSHRTSGFLGYRCYKKVAQSAEAGKQSTEDLDMALNLNMTKADHSACLAAVRKFRPDITLCKDKYSAMADTQAAYDSSHGAHAYVETKGWTGTCNGMSTGQCECPGWGSEQQSKCVTFYHSEGPGSGNAHGHYRTLMNTGSKCVACGYSGGTMTHNFCGSDSKLSEQVVV